MSKRKIQIPESLTQGQYTTQEEKLAVANRSNKLFIGIPKEKSFQENRTPLTPSSVATLIANGHRVVIENGAGEKSNFSDHSYSEVGADIAYSAEQVFKSNIILKVAPLTPDELEWLQPNQIVISPIHLPTLTESTIMKLKQKRVIALAWEYIKDDFGIFPLVHIMSEMAGISSMLTAAELLTYSNGGRGVLLGGISGVPSSKVVILGAGIVAEFASRTAIGLGADVRIFDNNIYKLKRIQNMVGRHMNTSAIIPSILEKELITADVVIGAMHSKSGRTPIVVSEQVVENMKDGAVIIDVSIDQGGCFATSKITSHDKPTFVKHGVIHYCVPNIASKIPRTASRAVSNILTPILLQSDNLGGMESMLHQAAGLRNGVYCYKGALTNHHIGKRFNLKSMDLDLLLTSRF